MVNKQFLKLDTRLAVYISSENNSSGMSEYSYISSLQNVELETLSVLKLGKKLNFWHSANWDYSFHSNFGQWRFHF